MGLPTLFRWLGVAGIELRAGGRTLLIDPYLTRIPFWRLWVGRVQADRALIHRHIPHCDHLLISHAHFDHQLDAPDVIQTTGATAYGSPNSCALLAICGVHPTRIKEIEAGDTLSLPPFSVDVLDAAHLRLLGFGPGPLRPGLKAPLHTRDYRLDNYLGFLIETPRQRIMVAPSEDPTHARPADILLVGVHRGPEYYETILEIVRPGIVFPIHWDDMWRPVTRPIRPTFLPPRFAWPPLQRVDMAQFRAMIRRLAPGVRVVLPRVFRLYQMDGVNMDVVET